MQDWTGALPRPNSLDSQPNYRTTNANSFHLGAEYTPDMEALRGYHKYMTYRLGGFYSNCYLSVLKPVRNPEPQMIITSYQIMA